MNNPTVRAEQSRSMNGRQHHRFTLLTFLLAATICFSSSIAYAATQLTSTTQSSGGLQSSASNQLWGVVGESSTGRSSGPTTVLTVGFLASFSKGTHVGGNISTNTTWSLAGSPYIVTSVVTVSNNSTLTIEPGVVVRFNADGGLIIGYTGILKAQGTSVAPITFTTNNPAPTPGQWGRINFSNTTPASILDYCIVEYGGGASGFSSSGPSIDVSYSKPIIQHSIIRYSKAYGIRVSGTSTGPTLIGNTFDHNGSYPLHVEVTNFPNTLSGNVYTANGIQAIELGGGTLSNNAIVPNENLPYIVLSSIVVKSAQPTPPTLTIEPGTILKFAANTGIVVGDTAYYIGDGWYSGVLKAQGTADRPILFTTANPTPAPGQWNGINFARTTDASVLDHCTIKYGGGDTKNTNIWIGSSVSTIQNSTIQFSQGTGISIIGAYSPLILKNLFITENKGHGIYVGTYVSPQITNTSITNNGGYGVFSEQSGGEPRLFTNNVVSNNKGGTVRLLAPLTTLANNTYTNNTAQTIELWGGDVQVDRILPNEGLPYVILSTILIFGGYSNPVTLTIEPGAVLKFFANTGLQVGGVLKAQGTVVKPIFFTTADPHPAPGQWNGIDFFSITTADSTLDFCTIEYGGAGTNNSNLLIDDPANPIIRHSTIRYSSGYGILTNTYASPTVSHCNVVNNTFDGLKNKRGRPLNCYLNWWGDASGPSGIGPGTGSAINGAILFEPWLGAPYTAPFGWLEVRSSSSAFTQSGGWTTFFGTLSEKGNWEITLKDSTGSVVKTFAGTSTSISQDWFGNDAGNNPLPNGIYTYQMDATSVSTGQAVAPAIGRIALDNTLPIAKITSPTQNQMLVYGTTINILGTAGGFNFSSYKLEYYPPASTQIGSGTTPVANGLLASWIVRGPALTNPLSTLRLTTTATTGKTATDEVRVRLLFLSGPFSTQNPFSPNGDGALDTTTLKTTATYPVNWTLTIKNSTGTVVKTLTGSGQTISQVWDGKNENGVVVPDGTYSYQFQGVNAETGLNVTSAAGQVVVDTTPPTATITSPIENQILRVDDPISFMGTADDTNFLDYTFAYGTGSSPSSFTKLMTSSVKIVNSTIYTLDFHKLRSQWVEFPAGIYTFRLTVRDTAGNVSILDRHVNFDYLYISNISVTPFVIDPYKGESAVMNYTLNRAADVTIRIYDDLTKSLIRTFVQSGEPSGANTTSWDGRKSSGVMAPLKAYYFTIQAQDSSGRRGTYNDASLPLLDSPSVSNFNVAAANFDPYKNDLVRVTYDLNAVAQVILKVYNTADFATVGILLNGVIQPQGSYTEFWDGRQDNGALYQGPFTVSDPTALAAPLNTIILNHSLADFSNFRAEAYLIQPVYSEMSTLTYNLSQDAKVSIAITDPNGNAVRTLLSNVSQKAGLQKLEWDGRTDGGKLVSVEGDYTVTMTAVDPVSGLSSKRLGSILVYK